MGDIERSVQDQIDRDGLTIFLYRRFRLQSVHCHFFTIAFMMIFHFRPNWKIRHFVNNAMVCKRSIDVKQHLDLANISSRTLETRRLLKFSIFSATFYRNFRRLPLNLSSWAGSIINTLSGFNIFADYDLDTKLIKKLRSKSLNSTRNQFN